MILAVPVTCCVALGTSLHLSGRQFPHLKNKGLRLEGPTRFLLVLSLFLEHIVEYPTFLYFKSIHNSNQNLDLQAVQMRGWCIK